MSQFSGFLPNIQVTTIVIFVRQFQSSKPMSFHLITAGILLPLPIAAIYQLIIEMQGGLSFPLACKRLLLPAKSWKSAKQRNLEERVMADLERADFI